ncbi:hypothetical protein ACN26Y_01630 [Micromonospora sp. WMMD558]|nr:hypothetical protein [Micromonospora sp. WMMC415]QGN50370.1 hypothetical protein GKC29_28470 [Micromonospora sp. WMMC415]
MGDVPVPAVAGLTGVARVLGVVVGAGRVVGVVVVPVRHRDRGPDP